MAVGSNLIKGYRVEIIQGLCWIKKNEKESLSRFDLNASWLKSAFSFGGSIKAQEDPACSLNEYLTKYTIILCVGDRIVTSPAVIYLGTTAEGKAFKSLGNGT